MLFVGPKKETELIDWILELVKSKSDIINDIKSTEEYKIFKLENEDVESDDEGDEVLFTDWYDIHLKDFDLLRDKLHDKHVSLVRTSGDLYRLGKDISVTNFNWVEIDDVSCKCECTFDTDCIKLFKELGYNSSELEIFSGYEM